MPNPFEPIKPSPPAAPPPQPSPEVLPSLPFDPTEWPTWSSTESSMHALIINTHPPASNTTKHTANASTTSNRPHPSTIQPTTPSRKRRPSKPAEGQLQDDAAMLLGEEFGIGDVLEALRGKVEAEKVVGRLLVWRREWQSGGKKGGDGGGDRGGECRKGDEAVLAKGGTGGAGKRVFQLEGPV